MLADQNIGTCIPCQGNRKEPIGYYKTSYKKWHKVENIFAKLKDYWRIAMRYNRCAHTFESAIYIATIVLF